MLYCPYCIPNAITQSLSNFVSGAGNVTVDPENKITIEFMIHRGGCKKVFLVTISEPSRDVTACFKLPDDWDQRPPIQNPPPPRP
jgi:hypothetical protein